MPDNLYQREPGGRWYARFVVAGRLQRRSLKTCDLREARKRLKAVQQKAERRAFGVEEAATWNQAAIQYTRGVLEAGSVKDGTAKRYLVSIRQLSIYFEGMKLADITPAVIADYVAGRKKTGTTNSTIRRDLTALSRILAFARTGGLIQSNPADGYDRKLIRERRDAIDAPTDLNVEAAARAMEAIGQDQLAAIIRFLRATGMRAGEALRARADHRHGGDLVIMETKNGRARTIGLGGAADRLPGKGRLFPGLQPDSALLASKWGRYRANLPDEQRFRLHDLRHAYAIGELRDGRDIYDLSHHLGHSSVKTTEIYLGYTSRRIK